MVNPFDLKTVLLAKHAQHVVLIHFPIAQFLTAVGFYLVAQWTKRPALADSAYYNLLGGSDFNSAGSHHWNTRLAVPTRGSEIERHPIAVPGAGVCFERGDFGWCGGYISVRRAAGGSLAALPPRV
jgi:hypothetical protein